MNFINDRELARRFKNNAVPSKERFIYLLLFTSLTTLFLSPSFVSNIYPAKPNQWDIYTDIISIIISILGTVICYRSNKSGDDKEFIERYISIGFPVAVQSLLILIGVGIIFFGLIEFTGQSAIAEESSIFDLIIMTLFMLYYYGRLNSSIKNAAH